jgi:dienelactone hydrolase
MHFSRALRVLPFALCFSAACGSSSSGSSASAPQGIVARFDLSAAPMSTASVPAFMAVPFPSDVYLQGGKVVEIPQMSAIVKQNSTFITHELAKMDGFSRTALALFYVDDATAPQTPDGLPAFAKLDPKTLPDSETACVADTSSVFLVDLAATDPTKVRVPCQAFYHQDVRSPDARTNVAVGPARGVVLQPAHAYAAVLTSRVKATDGRAAQASADFEKVRSGGGGSPAVYTSAYTKVMAAIGSALGKDGAQVVALAPYTTNDMAKQLYAVRDGIESASAPALKWDAQSMAPMSPAVFAASVGGKLPTGATASLDAWLGTVPPTAKLMDNSDDPDGNLSVRAHDLILEVGTGVFEATNWLTHYTTGSYQTLDHATFTTDASGNIVPAPDAPTDKIWVTFAVPQGTMPSTGWPVVIIQHGLGGSRQDLMQLANPLCQQGWMVAAIDSITFGARAPEAGFQVDKANNFAGPGSTYMGPDGIADAVGNPAATNGSTDLFGVLIDIGAIRDQFRQASLDTAQLVKVLRSKPDLSGLALNGATPAIDPDRIAYIGQSLGAIEGATAAAIEPHVQNWVINVGGGGLIRELAAHSPVVSNQLNLAAGFNFGFVEGTFDEAHVLVTLLQTIVDPGDPLSFASNVVQSPQPLAGAPTKPRNVLQLEVVYDEWVPNESNEALARAGGWGLGNPNVGPNAGVFDYKNLSDNPGRMSLPTVAAQPDGAIHDTPMAGVTAVMVQESPAVHGNNLTSSSDQRSFCIPFGNYASPTPFASVPPFPVPCPYLKTQSTIERFLSDGFAGKVPGVVPPETPVRDLDADGVPDATDPNPCGK